MVVKESADSLSKIGRAHHLLGRSTIFAVGDGCNLLVADRAKAHCGSLSPVPVIASPKSRRCFRSNTRGPYDPGRSDETAVSPAYTRFNKARAAINNGSHVGEKGGAYAKSRFTN